MSRRSRHGQFAAEEDKIAPPTPTKPMPPPVDEVPKGMDLVNYVAQCLGADCDPLDVRKQLMAFGFSEPNAEKYIADTIEWMRKNPYAGKPMSAVATNFHRFTEDFVFGIVLCVVGIGMLAFFLIGMFRGHVIHLGVAGFGSIILLAGIADIARAFWRLRVLGSFKPANDRQPLDNSEV
jgi:hypothetical protein